MISKKLQATVNYKSVQKSVPVSKQTTIANLRAKFEKLINFNLGKFKLIHTLTSSDLLFANENLSLLEYFGEESLNHLLFDIVPKEFTEQYYIQMFEKEYFKNTDKDLSILPNINQNNNNSKTKNTKDNEKDNEKDKKIYSNNLSSINKNQLNESSLTNKNKPNFPDIEDPSGTVAKELPKGICSWDKLNKSSYICVKCRNEYCKECIKFDAHPSFLLEKTLVDSYCKTKREKLKKELEDKVINNKYYPALNKIEFLINDKIKEVENQFEEMIFLINRIKDMQIKFLIDLYYQQVEIKENKDLPSDIDYFNGKYKQIEISYCAGNEFITDNLDNSKILENFYNKIEKSFKDFCFKYSIFDNMYSQYNNFNESFLNQIQAKLISSNNLRKQLNNIEKLNEDVNKLNERKEITNFSTDIMKISYYNSISVFNNTKMKIKKYFDFIDNCEFKINYQLYDGNINLNWKKKLFVLTGNRFNLLYMYDFNKNTFYKFGDLSFNYSRGGMIVVKDSYKRYNLLCIGGKVTNKVEYYDISSISEDESNDNSFIELINIKPKNANSLCTHRYHFSVYLQNDKYVYVFFGINPSKGALDTVERLNILDSDIDKANWELVYFKNPKSISVNMHSVGLCRLNQDEILIIGGVTLKNQFSNKIMKYNFSHETIYMSSLEIPDIDINEYYRFWEESSFLSLKDNSGNYNTDNDFFYGMFDARNKMHLINVKTLQYKVISC